MTALADRRWIAISGAAFVVFFVTALVMLGDQLGSVGDPDRQFISYHADVGNRAQDIAGAYLLIGAAVAFLAFMTHIYALLRRTDDASILPIVALASGVALVVMLVAAAAALSAVSVSLAFADVFGEEPHQFGPDVSRLATQLGFLSLVFGMLLASSTVAATSLSAMKSAVFPRWLIWLGLVAAVVLLFSFFFLPVVALLIWVLVVSGVRLREARE